MTSFQTRQIGNYVILDQLAVGGISEVFRSMVIGDKGCGKLIALKKILHHLSKDEDLMSSFLEQAELAAILNHQNIVPIYDYGHLEGTCFIAMEYLSGRDCRSLIRNSQEKQIPLYHQNAIFIVSRVCAGLDYAHKLKDSRGNDLNIIHRDISPQNVLVTYEGDIKIVDFGIAKSMPLNIHAQKIITKNKLAYMSPELAREKTIDHRSDIFSCGLLLYELITGNQMLSRDILQISAKIKSSSYFKSGGTQSKKVQVILERALQVNPDDRYQSCQDMQNDLEECLQEGALPSSAGLSEYMNVLFSEEISTEKQHLQKIVKRAHIQVEGKASDAPMTSGAKLVNLIHDTKIKVTESIKSHVQNIRTRKSVLVGISIGMFLVIIFIATISQRSAVSRQHQIQAKTEPEVSTESVETAMFQKGMEALINRQFEKAITLFKEVLFLDPKMKNQVSLPYAEALVGLANSLNGTNPEQAISLFNQAIQFDPNRVQSYFQLGMIFLKQDDYAAAAENFEKVIEINPNLPDAFFNLGFIHAHLKEYVNAEEMYAQVVELNPSYLDEALFNLALIQSKLGKKDESVTNVKKAVEVNPKNELAQDYLRKIQGVTTE
jgi:serine/threonine protein kinase